MKPVKSYEEFILENELSEMRITSAGVKELLKAIYNNWDKLKAVMRAEWDFDNFKEVVKWVEEGDRDDQDELEQFVKNHGIVF